MDAITEAFSRAIGDLLERGSGPLHFRLVLQPIVASVLAIKAGLRDARKGQTPFLWDVFTNREKCGQLIRSVWKDIGKLFTVAFLIDTVYQIFMLHAFYLLQALIVAMAVAVVPYTLLRGLVTRIVSRPAKLP